MEPIHSISQQNNPYYQLQLLMGCCANPPKKTNAAKDPTQNSKGSQGSQINFNPRPLFCPRSHQITKICISKQCKAEALFCSRPQCGICTKLHPDCKFMMLASVQEMIQQRVRQHRQLMKKMQQIQVKMIHEIVSKRKANFQHIFNKGISQRYVNIVDALYYQQNDLIIQGREAYEFCEKLTSSNTELPKIQQELLKKYQQTIQREAQSLSYIQNSILDEYAYKCRIDIKDTDSRKLQIKSIGSSKSFKPQNKALVSIDSKILDKNLIEPISFINEALNYPNKIQLIFRASEHNFKAAKFHEACDGLNNTFTLILTEFKKIVGGFTPIRWNETQGFAKDEKEESFLVSVSLKQKMKLVRPQKAIQCIPSYGPVFGGGADIAVSDQCNTNRTSCTNFSYSYNYRDMYQYNQEAWEALCGVSTGKYFKVKEYEVFKVTW